MAFQEDDSAAGLFPDQICSRFELTPPFRGKQLFTALQQGAVTWEQVSTFSKADRLRLQNTGPLFSSRVISFRESEDGSSKALVSLKDNIAIEAVLLVDETGRRTACLSSQAGCAMGCRFCRTGSIGLLRNLAAGEILEQYYHLKNRYGTIGNIVFMGMGEPLANLPALRKAVELLNHPQGPAVGIRKITVSTCGLIKGIMELAEKGPYPRLACSLVTADPELRKKLMPVSASNPLPELKKALSFYQKQSGRRLTLEIVLLGGINANREEAKKVASFAEDLSVLVNIIPWNPAPELDYIPPTGKEIDEFTGALGSFGISVSRRFRRGSEIDGACGQLAVFENRSDPSDPGR
jgi:23S rRNA (adenine2503-C2)-methyltransferase